MRTFRGASLDLREPDPAAITFDDVAHGLAYCRRFSGTGISVAEHSVIVARHLRDEEASAELVLAGLLHDAAEAFTGDIIRPVKALIRGHRAIERSLEAAVLTALGLPDDLPLHSPVVKAADLWALGVERGRYVQHGKPANAARRAFEREYRRCLQDLA